jgi:glycerol-3-phosphate acyltransferase PlsY
MTWWPWLLPLAAYALGSISFAWIAGRLKGIDLREHGSRNLGATNAGRVLGKRWFFAVFVLDLGKGLVAVRAAMDLPGLAGDAAHPLLPLACAVAVVLGHVFTCFHGFKGGKAVATSLGVLIALMPDIAAIAFAAWLVAWIAGWALFRLPKSAAVGPASVVAAIVAPTAHLLRARDAWGTALPTTVFICLLGLLVVIKHRSNLAKLLARPAGPGDAPR